MMSKKRQIPTQMKHLSWGLSTVWDFYKCVEVLYYFKTDSMFIIHNLSTVYKRLMNISIILLPHFPNFINNIFTAYVQLTNSFSTKVIHISTSDVHILCENIRSLLYILQVFHNIHKHLLVTFPHNGSILVVLQSR